MPLISYSLVELYSTIQIGYSESVGTWLKLSLQPMLLWIGAGRYNHITVRVELERLPPQPYDWEVWEEDALIRNRYAV